MSSTEALPNPVFEGSEKRVEVHFATADSAGTSSDSRGLRALNRSTLDHLMSLAACEIVSCTSNEELDSYVLSESSLFVYPSAWVLKTCGTTKLLNCLADLLGAARKINLVPSYVKFTRASFLFPEQQPEEHSSFDQDLSVLRSHFGALGNGGSAFVLGDKCHGLQWHLYIAAELAPTSDSLEVQCHEPLHSLEMCMTDLEAAAAAQFVRTPDFVSSAHTTSTTGIRDLMPKAVVDDYVFEPCGYSMNGIAGSQHMTIHVTPEEGFSYASCELQGFTEHAFDTGTMVDSVTSIFRPGRLIIACTTKSPCPDSYTWASTISVPGYCCAGATCQELPSGGRVCFYSLVSDTFRTASSCEASKPPKLSRWPSFAPARSREDSDRMDTISDNTKSKGQECLSDSRSSASEMEFHDVNPLDSVRNILSRDRPVTLPEVTDEAVTQHAQSLLSSLEGDETVFVVNLAAVSSAVRRWKAALPGALPLCHVADCPDGAVLSRLAAHGAAFLAATREDVEALCRAGVAMGDVVVSVDGWRPRDVQVAVCAGARLFAVSHAVDMAKLQRFAAAANVLLVAEGADAGRRVLAVAAAAGRAGLRVQGVLVRGDIEGDAAAAVGLARQVCCELEEEGHAVQRLAFVNVGSGSCAAPLHDALEHDGKWSEGLEIRAGDVAELMDAIVMLSSVHTVDGEGVHVTDLPGAGKCSTMKVPKVLPMNDSRSEDVRVVSVLDGNATERFELPRMEPGDWLAFSAPGDVGGILSGAPRFYVDCGNE